MHNVPFGNKKYRVKEILEIVYMDLSGPHATVGNLEEKYFLSFVDDYSKLTKIYCIKTKDKVYEFIEQYANEIETLSGKRIRK